MKETPSIGIILSLVSYVIGHIRGHSWGRYLVKGKDANDLWLFSEAACSNRPGIVREFPWYFESEWCKCSSVWTYNSNVEDIDMQFTEGTLTYSMCFWKSTMR